MNSKCFVNVFTSIIIVFLMLQRVLEQFIPFATYFDELVLSIFGLLYICKTIKCRRVNKEDGFLIISILILIIIGLLGNKFSGYSRETHLILEAIIFWFKSFGVFMFSYFYFDEKSFDSNKIISIIARITKIMVIAASLVLILSPLTKYGLDMNPYQIRYGLHPYGFIYPEPAIFSWYCLFFMLILTLENSIKKNNNFLFLVITSIVWFFTLRSRAFVYIVVYWILYYWIYRFPKDKVPKIKLKYLIIIGLSAIIIAIPAINHYFARSTSSRAILLRTGVDIGDRYFPLGVGFANFGTTPSYKEYSDVYYYYGFDSIYALKYIEGRSNEITDSYWPAIIGEMGFLGLLIMIFIIFLMFKRLLKKTRNNKWTYMCTLFFVLTSLFSSVATPIFSQDIMIGYIIVIIMACYIKPTKSIKGE